MTKKNTALLGAASIITLLTLASRVAGFVRTWVQNGALGDTAIGVAFSTSNTVPNILFEVVAGGALAGVVIPLVSHFLIRKDEKSISQLVSALYTWILTICLPLCLLVVFFAYPLCAFLLGDVPQEEISAAALLLRIFAWQIPLYGLSVVAAGVLQAHERFLLPALSPLISALIVTATFIVFGVLAQGHQDELSLLSTFSVEFLGIGTTIGVAGLALPSMLGARKYVHVRLTWAFPPGVAKRALALAGAGVGGLLAQQINIITIMLVANHSSGSHGAYPIYTFANAIYVLPYAVLAVPIATVCFPRISAKIAEKNHADAAVLTAQSTRLIAWVGWMSVALVIAEAWPAANIFSLLRPASGLATALFAHAYGLIGYCLIYHCSRILFACEKNKLVAASLALGWLSASIALIVFAHSATSRQEVLSAIGYSHVLGMSVGAAVIIACVVHVLGKDALVGCARTIIGGCVLASASGWGFWALTKLSYVALFDQSDLSQMSLAASLCAALLGAVFVMGIFAIVIYLCEKETLKKMRRSRSL